MLDRCFLLKPLHAVDVNIKQAGNIEFGLHTLRGSGMGMKQPQVQILAHLPHDDRIRQIRHADAQPVGHVIFGFTDLHSPGNLHAGHQISGSPHSAHSRGNRVGDGHAKRITDAHLQPVQTANFDHGFGCS